MGGSHWSASCKYAMGEEWFPFLRLIYKKTGYHHELSHTPSEGSHAVSQPAFQQHVGTHSCQQPRVWIWRWMFSSGALRWLRPWMGTWGTSLGSEPKVPKLSCSWAPNSLKLTDLEVKLLIIHYTSLLINTSSLVKWSIYPWSRNFKASLESRLDGVLLGQTWRNVL